MKTKILSKIRRSAKKSYDIEAFDELFLDVYLLTYLIRLAASTFSLFTGFYFLLTVFGSQLEVVAKYILAGITIIVLETLKYYITPKAFSNLFKSNFTYGIPTLIVALPLYAGSIFFTINGVSQYFDDKNQVVESITESTSNETIQRSRYYDSLISVEQNKYERLLSQHEGTVRMGWSAIIDQFNKIESRIDTYTQEKREFLASLKQDQQEVIEQVKDENGFIKSNTIYIAIASETLLFLAFLFSQYYLYRAAQFIEKKTPNSSTTRRVVVSVPKLGVIKGGRKITKLDQVKALVSKGVTNVDDIAKRIDTHPNYARTLLNKID